MTTPVGNWMSSLSVRIGPVSEKIVPNCTETLRFVRFGPFRRS
jgi:hypothetical protein